MIRWIKNFGKGFSEWDSYLTRKFVEHSTQLCYWPQLFLVLAVAGIPWLVAWHGDIIAPWMDSVLGMGPHDIDTAGKIWWRRVWSSALCGPFIAHAIIKFAYNRYVMYRDKKGDE